MERWEKEKDQGPCPLSDFLLCSTLNGEYVNN